MKNDHEELIPDLDDYDYELAELVDEIAHIENKNHIEDN